MSNKKISIIQLGVGGVGRAMIDQILDNRVRHETDLNLSLTHVALTDSDGILFNPDGVSDDYLLEASKLKAERGRLSAHPFGEPWNGTPEFFENLQEQYVVVVDVTATDHTIPILREARSRNWGIAMANKLPLSDSSEIFSELTTSRLTKYETTVAAALPVISTIQNYLLDTGDDVKRVWGSVSGTMNLVCQRLEAGERFSEIIRDAKAHGHTEPDPREDIGGRDSGRKALILARLLGQRINFEDVQIESLYPAEWDSLSVDEFMTRLPDLDEGYAEMTKKAQAENLKLRYLIDVEGTRCSAGLKMLTTDDDIIRPSVADSVVAIQSERYSDNPMLIRGRGSGPRLTASGVLSDVLGIAQTL